MTLRGWHVVASGALLAGLAYGWGAFVLAYLAGWWAVYIAVGGLRGGVRIRLLKFGNPLSGFGEEPPPRLDDPSPR